MKKLILLIAFLAPIFFCGVSKADIQLKYGNVVASEYEDENEDDTLTWAGIWGETNNCDYCIALFVLETYNKDRGQPKDRLIGVDYVIKNLETKRSTIRTNLGFAMADQGLQGGEVFNFHLGFSVEAKDCFAGKYSCLLSFDHFSNGMTLFDRDHIVINNPLNLLSIGIGF